MRKWIRIGAAGVLLMALVFVATAEADHIKVQLTAAGNATAQKAVLRHSDVGSSWKGGQEKPNLSNNLGCKTYNPKQSDLTVIGGARSVWNNAAVGGFMENDVQVLSTPRMVRLDWQRTVTSPKVMPCLRTSLAKSGGKHGKLVSLKTLKFPRVAPLTHDLRAILAARYGRKTVRIVIDVIAFGRGRTEQTLTLGAPAIFGGPPRSVEIKLARKLAGRSS